MTPFRQRMLDELQRRNHAPSTGRIYLSAVQQFAEHFHCSPDQLGPEHMRRYQIFLLQEKKLEPSTVEIRISALRFQYKRTLKRSDLAYDDLIFPKVPHKLPTVLSQDEVVRLIDAAPNRLYRTILVLLYATGVRRTEAAQIKVEDIDSQGMGRSTSARARARETAMCRSRRSCHNAGIHPWDARLCTAVIESIVAAVARGQHRSPGRRSVCSAEKIPATQQTIFRIRVDDHGAARGEGAHK